MKLMIMIRSSPVNTGAGAPPDWEPGNAPRTIIIIIIIIIMFIVICMCISIMFISIMIIIMIIVLGGLYYRML